MQTDMNPTFPQSARTFRLVLLLAGVLLAMPQMALAQSAWTSPFDPAPEEEQEETTPWGAPGENPTYSNPWGVDDGWGTGDPWGTEDRWDTDNPWGTGSDWSSEFYDFDDDSSSGSVDRVGDGPMMASIRCTSDSDCTGAGGNALCCINSASTESACSNNAGNCTGGDAGDLDGGTGGDPIEDPNSADPIPVDGGLLYLVIIGVVYGAYKLPGF